jgi:hypothetical protein
MISKQTQEKINEDILERRREAGRRYFQNNHEKCLERHRRWSKNNRKTVNKQRYAWSLAHPKKIKEYKHEDYLRHREHILARIRKYRRTHKDQIRKNKRESARKHRITIVQNGNRITLYGVIKRSRPHNCELCRARKKRFDYHHWKIDGKNVIGIWVCRKCHGFVEGIEHGLGKRAIDKYLSLKKRIR